MKTQIAVSESPFNAFPKGRWTMPVTQTPVVAAVRPIKPQLDDAGISAVNWQDMKHSNAPAYDALKNENFIEIFDDEETGQVHLYISDGTLRRFARSVATDSIKHFNDVLGAWGISRKLIDCRNDKTIPLPI